MICFYDIISKIENHNNNNKITVSEYFNKCIAQAINENEMEFVAWFCKIKNDVEGELVAWSKIHIKKKQGGAENLGNSSSFGQGNKV